MYKKLKESYTLQSDSNYIIAMFLTGGLCEEAANCIYTLKKLNLQAIIIGLNHNRYTNFIY